MTENSTPKNTDSTTAEVYRNSGWVYSADGKVRATFDHIGEGYNGDFDEDDPNDAALYRLDVEVAAEYREEVWGEETDDPEWVYPSDGSICTQVEMDHTDEATCLDLLKYAADSVAEAITSGTVSVKRAMDRLSWLPTKR